jgi:hypothetical protein
MDPRQSMNRPPSTNISQGPYNASMASPYATMPYQNQQQQHLPPIQSHQSYQQPNHNFMPGNYRPELPRYQSATSPLPAPDRYSSNTLISPQATVGTLPSASLLPQPNHQYQQNQSYPPTSSASQGYPTRIAPAPPRTDLTSMSTSFPQTDNRMPHWSTAETSSGVPADASRDPSRTHVVGSQGRRGILPSAPGRSAAAPEVVNGSPKNSAIPAKDADGKFPCANCNKTYLHAKHLKRHMLRR